MPENELHKACLHGNIELIKKLLNEQDSIFCNEVDQDECTPFYITCEKGDAEALKLLLESEKIDLNKPETCGWTPFSAACFSGSTEVIKLLLKNSEKIDLNKANNVGQTPFWIACRSGNTEAVAEMLNSEKIDLNKPSNSGQTPFSIACEIGHLEIVRLLSNDNRFTMNEAEFNLLKGLLEEKKDQELLVTLLRNKQFTNQLKLDTSLLSSELSFCRDVLLYEAGKPLPIIKTIYGATPQIIANVIGDQELAGRYIAIAREEEQATIKKEQEEQQKQEWQRKQKEEQERQSNIIYEDQKRKEEQLKQERASANLRRQTQSETSSIKSGKSYISTGSTIKTIADSNYNYPTEIKITNNSNSIIAHSLKKPSSDQTTQYYVSIDKDLKIENFDKIIEDYSFVKQKTGHNGFKMLDKQKSSIEVKITGQGKNGDRLYNSHYEKMTCDDKQIKVFFIDKRGNHEAVAKSHPQETSEWHFVVAVGPAPQQTNGLESSETFSNGRDKGGKSS